MTDLMTTAMMAEFCGVSEKTICKEIKAGRLKARKTGKGWTTPRHIVVEFREECYQRGEE